MASGPNPSNGGDGDGEGKNDAAVARTAGLVVFSGIAVSIVKALIQRPRQPQDQQQQQQQLPPPSQPATPAPLPLQSHPIEKRPVAEGSGSGRSSSGVIEIAKGDTLWGLSRKYGVSINAIKEANGLSGDTIYAGKKLIIPS